MLSHYPEHVRLLEKSKAEEERKEGDTLVVLKRKCSSSLHNDNRCTCKVQESLKGYIEPSFPLKNIGYF
jgi:hypothetical protein